ncbi:hypothetical protein DL95DRAFT_398954 [Leptodontidium sp. 2 PMI_412]|nr:hypothetical protein DL95DRAFT_398954 [Leptodontidium sp. 2 PMI_412]
MPPSFRLNSQICNTALYARVRDIWFQDVPSNATTAPKEAMKRWFGRYENEDEKKKFDELCHAEFHTALDSFGPANYALPPPSTSWATAQQQAESIAALVLPDCVPETTATASDDDGEKFARDSLSIILLLDQLPRNIFRENQAVIYAHYDRIALSLLYCLLRRTPRVDLHPPLRFSPAYRVWFYMPLMHSEYIEDHEQFAEFMESLKEEVLERGGEEAAESLGGFLWAGKMHADVIRRFGRYPHRNEWLRRETTREEKEYMDSGGAMFGSKPKPKA